MKQSVTIPLGALSLSGVIYLPPKFSKGVVFIHGGGRFNLERYAFLQHYFELHSIASLVFDCRGCGLSDGVFEESSLRNRMNDAEAALTYFQNLTSLPIQNIYVWGSSMGAHIASRLIDTNPQIAGVILQSGAAYGLEAEHLPMNEEFSAFIRKPDSWKNSPAFSTLEKFKGKLLVVYGADDALIPEGVKEHYRQLCKSQDDFIELEGGIHTLLRPQNERQKKALVKLAEVAVKFI